jgi:endogenous inhibitor of DNA gyrase (YacG/DUF329 family)
MLAFRALMAKSTPPRSAGTPPPAVQASPCPLCHGRAAPRSQNAAYPFCSERCRLIDLGRWLGEEYRIPGERAGDGEGGPGNGHDDGAGGPS